jgi:hypothetical protein
MTARAELARARKSLARGRTDEALVYLWNALEPARLEGSEGLRELQRLSTAIRERGDAGERREAERLLEAIGRSSEEGKPIEVGVPAAHVTEIPDAGASAVGDGEGKTEEAAAGSQLGRLLLPILLLLIIVINIVARFVDRG